MARPKRVSCCPSGVHPASNGACIVRSTIRLHVSDGRSMARSSTMVPDGGHAVAQTLVLPPDAAWSSAWSREGGRREDVPALDGATRSAMELEPCLTCTALLRPSLPGTGGGRPIAGTESMGGFFVQAQRPREPLARAPAASAFHVSDLTRIHHSVTTSHQVHPPPIHEP